MNVEKDTILTTSDRVSLFLDKSQDPEFELTAAKAYAVMWNTMDASVIEPFLDNDVRNESQNILEPIVGKNNLMDYLHSKLSTIRNGLPATQPFVELARFQGRTCLTMAQGQKEPPGAVILLTTENGKVKGIDLCTVVPTPEQVERTGIYPNKTEKPGLFSKLIRLFKSKVI
jgi:hypothetical protein